MHGAWCMVGRRKQKSKYLSCVRAAARAGSMVYDAWWDDGNRKVSIVIMISLAAHSRSGDKLLGIRVIHKLYMCVCKKGTPLGLSFFLYLPGIYSFHPLLIIFALLFYSLSLLVVTQIRGHIAGSSPPTPLRFVPCIFIGRRFQLFLPSSTRIDLCLPTPGVLSAVDPFSFLPINSKSHHTAGFELRPGLTLLIVQYHSRVTNCCGCLEGAFVVIRFSCPFLSLLFFVVLFCFVCHISSLGGGTTPLFFSFLFVCYFICFFVSCVFSRCQRIWIDSIKFICMSYSCLSYPVRCVIACIVYSAYCITM